MQPFEWTCRFCDRSQIATESNASETFTILQIGETKAGNVGVAASAIRCTNSTCNQLSLSVGLQNYRITSYGVGRSGEIFASWNLRPESLAKPQPDYIPKALREDYFEACLIRDKSPKAAATLARRCLQGMIRDFCNISKGTLAKEIEELRSRVESDSAPRGVEPEDVQAIDEVRSVGNIGAHMEKDIDLIIDVEPGEAQALIELVEMLFEEWYVARYKRQQRLESVASVAREKKEKLAELKSQRQAALPPPDPA